MSEYHTVYKDKEGTTTEWEDLMVKYGNLAPREKPKPPDPWRPAEDEKKDKEWIKEKSEEELEEMDDEFDDDRFLEEYRRKRLAELKDARTKPRFGSVELIKKQDFVHEVSQAPADVWVVVHLFKDGIQECAILEQCLEELAQKYSGTKFVRIISTECIKNYPDFNLPTLVVYNASQVKATLVGMKKFGSTRCTPEDVAFTLCQVGPVLVGSGEEGAEGVKERVEREYVERLVSQHEQRLRDDDSGDD